MPTKRPENLMPKDAVKAWGPDKIVASAKPRKSGGVAVLFTDGTREVYPSGVQVEVADVDNDPEHEGVTDEQRDAEVAAALAAEAADHTETAETVEAEVQAAANEADRAESEAEVAAVEQDARDTEEAADRAAAEEAQARDEAAAAGRQS